MSVAATAGEASQAQSSAEPASGEDLNSASSGGKQDRQVEVRWYDARARTALKKVAAWINVPWTKVATFECLAAEQAQVCYAQVLLTCWLLGLIMIDG